MQKREKGIQVKAREGHELTTWKEYTKETIAHAQLQGGWKIKLQIKGESYDYLDFK